MPALLTRRRSRLGALPYADDLQQAIINAAQGGGTAGSFTQGLRAAGHTTAEITTLYSNVAAMATVTPQIMSWLQGENAYLYDEQQKQNRLWMIIIAGGFALYLFHARKR